MKSGLNIIPARNVKMRWIVKVILRNPKRQKFLYKKWRKATHAATAFRFSGDRKRFGGLGCVKKIGLSRGEVITKGRLPAKIVLQWRSSSTKGRLALKVVFYQWPFSKKCCLPPKVVSNEGHLPPKAVFNHNTLVDLIFVRTVNIPNLA